ncbi:MAG: AMP phosphorylase [Thermofilum sp. ex4484_15]|nr:MAG: AMP phosphorylase [Thermofilum sp. ex4484_15]
MPILRVELIDISLEGPKLVILNEEDSIRYGFNPSDKVLVSSGDKGIVASVAVTKTVVGPGKIGLLKDEANELKVRNGDPVKVGLPASWESLEYIRKKIKGSELSREEIRSIVRDSVKGVLSEVEVAAFLLSEELVGMGLEEIVYLTEAMVEVGSRISFSEVAYDIHSIGGVPGNSKVALIEVPLVAAAGLLIPKTSSRAITSPAGTADTMEVLAPVNLTLEEVKKAAERTKGVIVWGGSLGLAPADDIFIRVERPLRVDPRSQTVASILSKKLAMGIRKLVADIPIGKGAKVGNLREAREYSKLFLEVSKRLGIDAKCAITYGGQPIGYYVGPALEAKEALIALQGKVGAMSLIDKATSLAGLIYEMAGIAPKGRGQSLAKEVFRTGKAWSKMKDIIEAQGGNPQVKPDDIEVGYKREVVEAPFEGYVTDVDNTAITLIARAAGAPRDKRAGVILYVKAGKKVRKGEKLMEIVAESGDKLAKARSLALRLRPITLEGMLLGTVP